MYLVHIFRESSAPSRYIELFPDKKFFHPHFAFNDLNDLFFEISQERLHVRQVFLSGQNGRFLHEDTAREREWQTSTHTSRSW